MSRENPRWTSRLTPVESPRDLIQAIVSEGVDRILLGPVAICDGLSVFRWMQAKGLCFDDAGEVDLFYRTLIEEAVNLSALLGYGLATVQPQMGDSESTLEAAITAAKLTTYRISTQADIDVHSAIQERISKPRRKAKGQPSND
ncbi:MAG: hypothetical protein EPO21_13230 [Chloroflexota bacterium]|nr:MAG: hypothetical protein EPO21_13230 [Chloroflexota bacterium]